MDPVRHALERADALWKECGYDSRALSPAMQTVQLIGQLDFEVNLGGVHGWLTNSSGRYCRETIRALEAIGAKKCAALVEEILAPFPGAQPPWDDAERARQVDRFLPAAGAMWRKLGDELLTWPDDVNALLAAYIAQHADEFSLH